MPLPWIACAYTETFLPFISLLASSLLTLERCFGGRTLEKSHFENNCSEFLRKEKWVYIVSVGLLAKRGVQGLYSKCKHHVKMSKTLFCALHNKLCVCPFELVVLLSLFSILFHWDQ